MSTMKILIVNNAEAGIDEFVQPLEKILEEGGIPFQTIEYKESPAAVSDRYGGFILSGSPRGDDIVAHHLPYFEWILSVQKPVLGICAGHHIMGRLYGAELLRGVEKEVGDFDIVLDQQDPLFAGFPRRFPVRQAHHDSVSLPREFVRLARSERCRVEAMKHRRRPLYSCQFHPEVSNPRMILNFVDIVAAVSTDQEGSDSLTGT